MSPPRRSSNVSAQPQRKQDAETGRQQRSRFAQVLNVPQGVRLRPSLAAVLLDELFEHPAQLFSFYFIPDPSPIEMLP